MGWENAMRRFLAIILLLLLFVSGCCWQTNGESQSVTINPFAGMFCPAGCPPPEY
jgi:hypothetical protein